jgi:hypothetical protein
MLNGTSPMRLDAYYRPHHFGVPGSLPLQSAAPTYEKKGLGSCKKDY